MQYRPYSQPVNPTGPFHQNPYQNPYQHQQQNPYSQMNGPPPLQQTPYEQFAKPQQPMFWDNSMQSNSNFNPQSNMNQQPNMNPPNGIINYFQDEDGQMDFDKMLSTVGQLASTYHQVSLIVKQVGSLIKIFR